MCISIKEFSEPVLSGSETFDIPQKLNAKGVSVHAPYVFLTKRMGPVKTQYSVLPVCEPLSDIVGDHRYKQVNKSNPEQVSSAVHALVQNIIHAYQGVSHRHIRLDSILSVGDSSTIQLSDFRYARLFLNRLYWWFRIAFRAVT